MFLFFFLVLSVSFASAYDFTENFPTSNWQQSAYCEYIPQFIEETLSSANESLDLDNIWQCVRDTGNSAYFRQDNSSFNSDYGIQAIRTAGTSTGCYYMYSLITRSYLTENSVIKWYNSEPAGGTNSYLMLIDTNGNVKLNMGLQSDCSYNSKPYGGLCCNVLNSTGLLDQDGVNISISGYNITQNCPAYQYENLTNFDYIVFASCYDDLSPSKIEFAIDDFSISNLALGNYTNSLPIANFSINTTFCFNVSEPMDFKNFSYTPVVSAFDSENDTIYYDIQSSTYKNFYVSQLDLFYNIYGERIYDIFTNGHLSWSNDTLIADEDNENTYWQWGSLFAYTYLALPQANEYTFLGVDQNARFTYNFEPILVGNSTIDFTFLFPKDNVKFDIIVLDSMENIVQNITFFKYNSTNLNITKNGVEVWEGEFDNYLTSWKALYMQIEIYDHNNTINTKFYDWSTSEPNLIASTSSTSSFSSIPWVYFYTYNTQPLSHLYWYLYSASANSEFSLLQPNWQSSLDPVYEANIHGNELTLYITDSYHLNTGEYRYYKLNYIPPDCRWVDNTPFEDNPDPLGIVKGTLGTSLRNYYTSMGWTLASKNMLYVVFFTLVLFIMVSIYLASWRIVIVPPVLISAMLCFFCALLIGSVEQIIVFIIVISLGLSPAFAKMFLGLDTGGKDN